MTFAISEDAPDGYIDFTTDACHSSHAPALFMVFRLSLPYVFHDDSEKLNREYSQVHRQHYKSKRAQHV